MERKHQKKTQQWQLTETRAKLKINMLLKGDATSKQDDGFHDRAVKNMAQTYKANTQRVMRCIFVPMLPILPRLSQQ